MQPWWRAGAWPALRRACPPNPPPATPSQNSTLVLTSENRTREAHEPSGEPESLWGRMKGKMGDRVQHGRPAEAEEKKKKKEAAQKKRKKQVRSAHAVPMQRQGLWVRRQPQAHAISCTRHAASCARTAACA